MNSNMVKPEKFDHLHLVYDFAIPLNTIQLIVTLARADVYIILIHTTALCKEGKIYQSALFFLIF